jgi:hypothetical protein
VAPKKKPATELSAGLGAQNGNGGGSRRCRARDAVRCSAAVRRPHEGNEILHLLHRHSRLSGFAASMSPNITTL